jgi:mannitol-1-phosphate 5-dehydrogenase
MKTAIHFGAGNIGRGFIGSLLVKAGYQVIFADVNQQVVDMLHQDRKYLLKTVGTNVLEEIMEPVDAYLVNDPHLVDIALDADLITTAVGAGVLPKLAPTIAGFIRARFQANIERPIQIIACENLFGASGILGKGILAQLNLEEQTWAATKMGYPNSVVDRIVPPLGSDAQPTDAVTEPYHEWVVERGGFVGEIPEIDGMKIADDLTAYVERKLLTLNTGHAVAAYVGQFFGHATIRESMEDPQVLAVVTGAMRESGSVLIDRHKFDPAEHEAYIQKIISRFLNPWLNDTVVRVGREPLRKLGPDDRMMRPLKLAFKAGYPIQNLLIGVAAGLSFESPDDPEACEIAKMLQTAGIQETLSKVTGLPENDKLLQLIADTYAHQTGDARLG